MTTGIFSFLKKDKGKPLTFAPTLSGGQPTFTDFGSNIYASDIVVQSIRCKANEFKKLKPRHIRLNGNSQSVITDSSVARVLAQPNPYMTTADFLEKIAILLELNKNVFIYPTYYDTKGGERVYTGLYPLKPNAVEYLADDSGTLHIKMRFANGQETTLLASEVIHWRKDYGLNDYFGGSAFGGNDDRGLLQMLDRYDKLLQSLSKALECSCQVNGIVKIDTYMGDEKLERERVDFQKRLEKNESGILFTDNATAYTHIPRDIKLVDKETVEFMYQAILRANGTSLAVLNGDYTPQQKQAYYEHALESDIISLAQAMSKVMFSNREMSFGNEIRLYPEDIYFWSVEQRIAYMNVAVPAGAMSVNQILQMGGLPPIEGGDTIRPRGYNELDTDTDTNPKEQEGVSNNEQ